MFLIVDTDSNNTFLFQFHFSFILFGVLSLNFHLIFIWSYFSYFIESNYDNNNFFILFRFY